MISKTSKMEDIHWHTVYVLGTSVSIFVGL
jgi:hypothetical protein